MSKPDGGNDESTDETLAEATEELRGQLTSRRGMLASSGALLGAGTLGLFSGSGLAQDTDGNDEAADGSVASDTDVLGTDVDVLNYALTLEHLEDAFYQQNLKSLGGFYSEKTTRGADTLDGFGDRVLDSVYDYLTRIGEHESTHVEVLENVIETLGGEPVGKAEYDFGTMVTDEPEAFLATAQALENTGVMAYDGALALIESPDLQTAAATVATVEARHASYLNLLNGDVPFPDAFDEAKPPEEILDIAGQFIAD